MTFGHNRRDLKEGKWIGFVSGEATDSSGPVDHSLPVLRVTDLEGKLVGIVANFACHCTTTSGSFNAIHGDWAGYAQKALESDHPGIVAMVTIGCGADVGPYPNGTLARAQEYGHQLGHEVGRLLEGEWKPLAPMLVARRETIQVPLGKLPAREELQRQAAGDQGAFGARDVARHFLSILDRDGELPASFDYPITTWTFGDDLAMVFLPGEVTIDYALRLKRELDGCACGLRPMPMGCPVTSARGDCSTKAVMRSIPRWCPTVSRRASRRRPKTRSSTRFAHCFPRHGEAHLRNSRRSGDQYFGMNWSDDDTNTSICIGCVESGHGYSSDGMRRR